MECPDDYTVQAIMRWGYPRPPNPRAEALSEDIRDLEGELKSKWLDFEILADEIDTIEEELREKREQYNNI